MNAHHTKIRELLKGTDGLTVKEIQSALPAHRRTICKSLQSMDDAYIDRWTGPYRGQWAAVYCVVDVPEDCPKPDEKNMEAPLLQTQRANRARQDDLGAGSSKGASSALGTDAEQTLRGQALGFLRKTLWRKRRTTDTPVDAVDKK